MPSTTEYPTWGGRTHILSGLCTPVPFSAIASSSYSRQRRQDHHSCRCQQGSFFWREHSLVFLVRFSMPTLFLVVISAFLITGCFESWRSKPEVFTSSKSPKCSSHDWFERVLPPGGCHFCGTRVAPISAQRILTLSPWNMPTTSGKIRSTSGKNRSSVIRYTVHLSFLGNNTAQPKFSQENQPQICQTGLYSRHYGWRVTVEQAKCAPRDLFQLL